MLLAGRGEEEKGQVEEAIPAPTSALDQKPWDQERCGGGWALEEAPGRAALTGLMSRCKKPTEWMASMDSRICLPSRSVVLSVKVPRGWLRRRSARFRPWGRWGPAGLSCPAPHPVAPLGCSARPHPRSFVPYSPPQRSQPKILGDSGGRTPRDSPGAASLRN